MGYRGFNDNGGKRKICEQEDQTFSFARSKTCNGPNYYISEIRLI
jgi:hypothetical protein